MTDPALAISESSILFEPRYGGCGIKVTLPKAKKIKKENGTLNRWQQKVEQLQPLLLMIFSKPRIGLRRYDRILGRYVDSCDRSKESNLASYVKRIDGFVNLGANEKVDKKNIPSMMRLLTQLRGIQLRRGSYLSGVLLVLILRQFITIQCFSLVQSLLYSAIR